MTTPATPVRIQRKRTRGFNLQKASPNGLPVAYIGRPTKWGNPIPMPPQEGFSSPYYQHLYAVQMFRILVQSQASWPYRKEVKEELTGKNLACWCPPDLPCHADVLLEILKQP